MSEYFFGLHHGHLKNTADRIAKRHGARHVNYTDPATGKRGWFHCPNRGNPFDQAIADAVFRDIDADGGLDSLRR